MCVYLSAYSCIHLRDSPIFLPRYPPTLPPLPLHPRGLHDLCAPSAVTGETTNAKNAPCRFAASTARVFTMKRGVNDASSERDCCIVPSYSSVYCFQPNMAYTLLSCLLSW